MLAYVFWHAPRAEEAGPSYEANLAAFHRALGTHPPPGFRGSVVLRAAAAPWRAMKSASPVRFTPELFRFLAGLKRHNNRVWFEANRERYLRDVRVPCLRFIEAFGPRLRAISRSFVADPRPVGGSLFRIHRDIRFSKDKSPYKTHVGMDFLHHAASGDAHAPGFYLHLEPGGCFAAAGVWHPDGEAVGKVRRAIAARPAAWRAVRRRVGMLEGDALVRPPRGFDPDHPFIEDIKRRDFVVSRDLETREVLGPRFPDRFASVCRAMSPLVRFLTEAIGLPYRVG